MTYQAFCQRCGKKFESTHELGDDFVCTSCYINVPDDSHYHKGDIDPWAYIKANKLDFFEASVVFEPNEFSEGQVRAYYGLDQKDPKPYRTKSLAECEALKGKTG